MECMFKPIDKEEMEVCVGCEFATLGKTMQLEKAMEKEVVKCLVGKPKKELVYEFCGHKGGDARRISNK